MSVADLVQREDALEQAKRDPSLADAARLAVFALRQNCCFHLQPFAVRDALDELIDEELGRH